MRRVAEAKAEVCKKLSNNKTKKIVKGSFGEHRIGLEEFRNILVVCSIARCKKMKGLPQNL